MLFSKRDVATVGFELAECLRERLLARARGNAGEFTVLRWIVGERTDHRCDTAVTQRCQHFVTGALREVRVVLVPHSRLCAALIVVTGSSACRRHS
jgi:hypothetical protein